MKTLDSLIERFENAVAEHGVGSVAPAQVVADWEAETNASFASDAITELLRVWLEYRFDAHMPVTAIDAQALFPNVNFLPEELQSLEFEYQRLSSRSESLDFVLDANSESLSSLPRLGETWNDFLLLEVLGEGAFARVYLARQLSMAGRLVALKLTFRATLESQLLARLHHSAIVPIYSMHQLGAIHGLCMPYLGNTTLMDLLQEILPANTRSFGSIDSADGLELLEILVHRQAKITTISNYAAEQDTQEAVPKFPIANHSADASVSGSDETMIASSSEGRSVRNANEPVSHRSSSDEVRHNRISTAKELSKLDYVGAITWIGAQLADALDHAHRHGVLHCDIKPANVLLAPDGQARLLDFNVSLEEHKASSALRYGGTLAYMAPEHLAAVQGMGKPQMDARSDIYSLGVVLFEMLSGAVPKQHASDEVIPVRKLLTEANPSVTPALAAIVRKCLATHPNDRYASAGQLYEDLNAQCNSLPLVHQVEPSYVERSKKWVRRHPTLTSVSSISFVAAGLVLLSLFGFLWRGSQLERLERTTRGDRLQQLLPDAISVASATRNYPELASEARRKSVEVLSLLTNQKMQEPDLSLVNDHAQLHMLVRLSRSNGLRQESAEAQDDATDQLAVDEYSAAIDQLDSAVSDLSLGDSVKDELLDAYLDGRYADVIELGSRLPDARANDYATWMFIGQSNLKVKDFSSARESFSVCIALQPRIEIAWFYRGIARLESKLYEASIADFSRAIELKARFPAAQYNMALAYDALGQTQFAIDILNQAIASGWHSVSGYAFRSKLYAKLGKQAEAERDLAKAIASRPTGELDWVRRGTLRLTEDASGSKQDFEQAIALNPNSISARQNLAHVLAEKLSKPEASLEHLDALVKLEATNAEHWAGRGVVLARLGHLLDALRDLSHASTLDMSNPLVAYQVACGYSLIASQMDELSSENSPGLPAQSKIGAAALKWYQYAIRLRPDVAQIAMNDRDVAWLRNQPEFSESNQSARSTSRD